jgi:hypothetical protein
VYDSHRPSGEMRGRPSSNRVCRRGIGLRSPETGTIPMSEAILRVPLAAGIPVSFSFVPDPSCCAVTTDIVAIAARERRERL